MRKIGKSLYYAAAATTAIAGILHLIVVSPLYNPYVLGTNIPGETFFIVAGIAQLFWYYPRSLLLSIPLSSCSSNAVSNATALFGSEA